MTNQLTIEPNIFNQSHHPNIVVNTIHENDLTGHVLDKFLDTVKCAVIGVAPIFGSKCALAALAFSTPSHVLVVRFTLSTKKSQSKKRHQSVRKQQYQGRTLLDARVFSCPDKLKYAFRMDRIVVSLFLDISFRIVGGVELLSSALADRRSLEAFMSALGGEATLNKDSVRPLHKCQEYNGTKVEDIALLAWAACQVGLKPDMTKTLSNIPRINTKDMAEAHLCVVAKICRDSERIESLKPTFVKNDVKAEFIRGQDTIILACTRFRTRIMKSKGQTLEIEALSGGRKQTVAGRAVSVEGRNAVISLNGAVRGDKIAAVTTRGKERLTNAESDRERVALEVLQRTNTLLRQPFFQIIWLPAEKSSCLTSNGPRQAVASIYYPSRTLNSSQKLAVLKIVSLADRDRTVVIQGPPGTGKTTVIAASVMTIMNSPDENRTIWIAAQSNVAVKNIAEKLGSAGFWSFKLLVSKDFHFDWHEHLYEDLQNRVIRSDGFPEDIVDASRLVLGCRVMLCTLSMLSNSRLNDFTRIVPVQTVIFDEASQIEVGDYIPMLSRFHTTLQKLVFIGDDKQLAPFGQDDISELRSVFEFPHLRKKTLFLDTQYRMPMPIGQFISRHVYQLKLKTEHEINSTSSCRFVNVATGNETKSGKSWVNHAEATVVIDMARLYHNRGEKYRIITPYDAQRTLMEKKLKEAKLPWENKCFNVDSFQGNEEDHIIISLARSEKIGFLSNIRRTNVMLTRCKTSMAICTSKAFITGKAAHSLMGKLASELGPDTWVDVRNLKVLFNM